jgi:hypothetical protein
MTIGATVYSMVFKYLDDYVQIRLRVVRIVVSIELKFRRFKHPNKGKWVRF